MPLLPDIAWVVQSNEPLDYQRHDVRRARTATLPSKYTEPAHAVAERFLVLLWTEFRDPVVLAA